MRVTVMAQSDKEHIAYMTPLEAQEMGAEIPGFAGNRPASGQE